MAEKTDCQIAYIVRRRAILDEESPLFFFRLLSPSNRFLPLKNPLNLAAFLCETESSPDSLTSESSFFLEPASPAQRQYEALRAYFVEGLSTAVVSHRFGYTPGSFRVLCHHFRRSKPDFFRELKRGPHSQPKKDAVRELILGMRKQNLSIYDIESALKNQQTPLSTTAIWEGVALILDIDLKLRERPSVVDEALVL